MKVIKQILIVVFSLLLVGLFIFILTWGILNWSKVKDGMSGSAIYTETDIKTAYEDGYSQALADKAEYEKLLVQYRALIERYEKELAELKKPQAKLALVGLCKRGRNIDNCVKQEPLLRCNQSISTSLQNKGDKL